MGRLVPLFVAALLILPTLILPPPILSDVALAQSESDIRGTFREGIDFFEQGRYEDAFQALEKALALRPSADLALELRDQAGYQIFLRMLAQEGDIATVAREILKLARRGEKKLRVDPAWIQSQFDRLRSDDIREQYLAREDLVSRAGQFAVPYAVDALGDKREDDYRVRVIDFLVALGPDAVLPLTEVLLHAPDTFTRQNAAVVLGHVKDARALAPLKKVFDHPQTSQHVRTEAGEALRKVTGVDPSRLRSAQEYSFDLARRYYLDEGSVTQYFYQEWGVWDWVEGEGLVFRSVPSYAWNEEMAEKSCYQCLDLDPSYDRIWSLLVGVYYAQVAEVDETLDLVKQKIESDDAIRPEDKTTLEEAQTLLQRASSLNLARGQRQLLRALRMAMDDGMPQVAQRICLALRDMRLNPDLLPLEGAVQRPRMPLPPADEEDAYGQVDLGPTLAEGGQPVPRQPRAQPQPRRQPQPVQPQPQPQPPAPGTPTPARPPRQAAPVALTEGQPLIDALTYPDKRVRYAAAEALAAADPPRPFRDYGRVVDNLVDALAESGPRAALVIDNDANVRNRVVGVLRNIGLLAYGVESGRQGIDRARSFPAEDVIIVSESLPERNPDELNAFDILDALKVDYRTAHIPVIVLADPRRVSKLEASFEGRADELMAWDVDEVRLRNVLDDIFRQERFRRDAKTEAVAIARRAAEAIGALDATHTIYPVHRASDALTRSLETQPDEVRIPAMVAIGRLRVRSALPQLIEVFDNKDNIREVRIAAADAIGEVVKPSGEISPRIFASLKAGLAEEDRALRDAVAGALGKANLSAEQARQVFVEYRVK